MFRGMNFEAGTDYDAIHFNVILQHIKKKDDINDVESFLSKVLDPRDPDTRRLREVFIRRWDADQDFDDQLDGLRGGYRADGVSASSMRTTLEMELANGGETSLMFTRTSVVTSVPFEKPAGQQQQGIYSRFSPVGRTALNDHLDSRQANKENVSFGEVYRGQMSPDHPRRDKKAGLRRHEIALIPSLTYARAQENALKSCGICDGDYELNDNVRFLSCFHHFHMECVDKWLMDEGSCPICRANVFSIVYE